MWELDLLSDNQSMTTIELLNGIPSHSGAIGPSTSNDMCDNEVERRTKTWNCSRQKCKSCCCLYNNGREYCGYNTYCAKRTNVNVNVNLSVDNELFVRRWARSVLVGSSSSLTYKCLMDDKDTSLVRNITRNRSQQDPESSLSLLSSPAYREAMTIFHSSTERKSWTADDFKCWLSLTSDFPGVLQRVLSGSQHKNTKRPGSSKSCNAVEDDEKSPLMFGNKIKDTSSRSYSARFFQIFKRKNSCSLEEMLPSNTGSYRTCPFGYYSHTNGIWASPFLLHQARVQQMETKAARVILGLSPCSSEGTFDSYCDDEEELNMIVDSFQCCTDWVVTIPADCAIPDRKTRKVIDTFLKWHLLIPLIATLENGGKVDRTLEMIKSMRTERRAGASISTTQSGIGHERRYNTNDGSVVDLRRAEQIGKAEEFSQRIMRRYVSARSTGNCGVDVHLKSDVAYDVRRYRREHHKKVYFDENTQNESGKDTDSIHSLSPLRVHLDAVNRDRIEGELHLFGKGWGAFEGNVVPIVKVEQIKLSMLMDRSQLQEFIRCNMISIPSVVGYGNRVDPTITVVMLAKSFFTSLPMYRGAFSYYGLNHDSYSQALSFISEMDHTGYLLQFVTDILITIMGSWNNYDIEPPGSLLHFDRGENSTDPIRGTNTTYRDTNGPQTTVSSTISLKKKTAAILNSVEEEHHQEEAENQHTCEQSQAILPYLSVINSNGVADTEVKKTGVCEANQSYYTDYSYRDALTKANRLCGLNDVHNDYNRLRDKHFSSSVCTMPNGPKENKILNLPNTELYCQPLSADDNIQIQIPTVLSNQQQRPMNVDVKQDNNVFHQQCTLALKQLQMCTSFIHCCIGHTFERFKNISISERRQSYALVIAIETYIHSQLYTGHTFPVFARIYANEDRKLSEYHNKISGAHGLKQFDKIPIDPSSGEYHYCHHVSPVRFGASEDLDLFQSGKYRSIIESITEDAPCPFEKLQKMRLLFLEVSSDAEEMVQGVWNKKERGIGTSAQSSDNTCEEPTQQPLKRTKRDNRKIRSGSGVCADDMVALLSAVLVSCPCSNLYSNIQYLGVFQSEAIEEDSELDYVFVTFKIVIEHLLQECSK